VSFGAAATAEITGPTAKALPVAVPPRPQPAGAEQLLAVAAVEFFFSLNVGTSFFFIHSPVALHTAVSCQAAVAYQCPVALVLADVASAVPTVADLIPFPLPVSVGGNAPEPAPSRPSTPDGGTAPIPVDDRQPGACCRRP